MIFAFSYGIISSCPASFGVQLGFVACDLSSSHLREIVLAFFVYRQQSIFLVHEMFSFAPIFVKINHHLFD